MIIWGRTTVIECDSCNETIESEPKQEWWSFWAQAKREGWKSRRVRADLYTHGCPKHEA